MISPKKALYSKLVPGVPRPAVIVKVGINKQHLNAEGAETFDIDFHMAPKLEGASLLM